MTSHPSDPEKETIFLHDISPELEEQLLHRARANHRDPSAEASVIIESHLREAEEFFD